MSAIIRTRRRKPLPVSSAALWVMFGMAVVFFLFTYGQELLQAHDLNEKAAVQRTANASVKDEITRLQAQLQYYESDKYIEQRAREDLNLRRHDDEVLIPVIGGTAVPPDAAAASHAAPSPAATPSGGRTQAANWRKWLELFGSTP